MTNRDSNRTPFRKSPGFRRVKLALKRLVGREPRMRLDVRMPMETIGGWTLNTDLLGDGACVYSLGVGEDIRFDLELIERKAAVVDAFDPTPNSVRWLAGQRLPEAFRFHPIAIAEHDGSVWFYPRRRRDGSSSRMMYTMLTEPADGQGGVEVPARTLAGIARELAHERVDVLKMDIEGAEYEVLRGLLASTLRPTQLLIEFHHRFAGIGLEHTLEAIAGLRRGGYGLANISPSGREFSFVLLSRLR